MRVLLDECLPRRLKRELVDHDAKTAPEMRWASKTNGELLALATAAFDVFLTSDRNPSYQQNVIDCPAAQWPTGAIRRRQRVGGIHSYYYQSAA